MSHYTKCEVNIDDLDVLQSACEELGFEVLRDAIANGYGSTKLKAAMVIRGNGMEYDIAVNMGEDGYELSADYWGKSVENACSRGDQKLGEIFEMYSVHKGERLCKKKRKKFRRVRKEDRTTVEVFA